MPVDALSVARPRRLVEVVGLVLQAQETWTSSPHRCVCVCVLHTTNLCDPCARGRLVMEAQDGSSCPHCSLLTGRLRWFSSAAIFTEHSDVRLMSQLRSHR